MSPRAATRHDASARQFLDAAAALIDASLSEDAVIPARLKSIRFPAALEWIRVEDVIRLAGDGPGTSRKAFRLRWPTRDEFIRDAVVYTLQFRDRPADEYDPMTDRLGTLDPVDLGPATTNLARDLLTYAESSPRSYLMLHLGTLLHRDPPLQRAFNRTWRDLRTDFVAGYATVLSRVGLEFRPGWNPERFDRALQALTDGFLLQGRIRPAEPGETWTHLDLYAEAVGTLTLGAIDTERSGRSATAALTHAALTHAALTHAGGDD